MLGIASYGWCTLLSANLVLNTSTPSRADARKAVLWVTSQRD